MRPFVAATIALALLLATGCSKKPAGSPSMEQELQKRSEELKEKESALQSREEAVASSEKTLSEREKRLKSQDAELSRREANVRQREEQVTRREEALPKTPPEGDKSEFGRNVADSLIEAWKSGDQPAELWKEGKALINLFNVKDSSFVKTLTGDPAKAVCIRALESKLSSDISAVSDDKSKSFEQRIGELKRMGDLAEELKKAREGDASLVAKHAPGVYAVQRYRIKSTNRGGVPVEALWDVLLEKVGEGWTVSYVLETQ